ncbi:YcnI family protein [Benzoatithermus flavus]|uniref:DUF1775 domain-containing protein n=1 Tax=Benzoatithermus flavus TaxID=3108223 RepID=A0ABU8XN41_9PROT
MPSRSRVAVLATLATILAPAFAGPALAHATLETKEAPAGSNYRVVVRINHGCEGSPTLKIRMRIPEGVTNVEPEPKPGWEITLVRGRLVTPAVDAQDDTAAEGVVEVDWTGRLEDEDYSEFVAQVRLPDRPGATIYFPIIQECERGRLCWVEIPKAGQSAHDLKLPAPGVKLLPKK